LSKLLLRQQRFYFFLRKFQKTVYLHSTESGRKVQNFGNVLLIKNPLWYFLLFCSLAGAFDVVLRALQALNSITRPVQSFAVPCGLLRSFAVFSQTPHMRASTVDWMIHYRRSRHHL